MLPDLRLLRALIGHGIDLNQAQAGMTPLLAATRDSWHGRPDAVTTLLANGADPRTADREGNTPLHHAARSSDPGVAALLRDAAAEIDALNLEGVTPLGVACMAGNWRLAKFLLERGARPEPPGGQPVLLAAAATEEDDPAGVLLLLKHKAKVDTRDPLGRSALHEAALAVTSTSLQRCWPRAPTCRAATRPAARRGWKRPAVAMARRSTPWLRQVHAPPTRMARDAMR